MKIAIMGAMREEITPLLEYFKEYDSLDDQILKCENEIVNVLKNTDNKGRYYSEKDATRKNCNICHTHRLEQTYELLQEYSF